MLDEFTNSKSFWFFMIFMNILSATNMQLMTRRNYNFHFEKSSLQRDQEIRMYTKCLWATAKIAFNFEVVKILIKVTYILVRTHNMWKWAF